MRRLLLVATLFIFGGCISTKELKSIDVDTVMRLGKQIKKTFEPLTPEQEHYLGRTVAAEILSRYPLYRDAEATRYLNRVGTLLSYVSERPETFGGYHFAILDSDETNAFATPGGLIFVTRGMLRCTDSEDGVASVLAHEIAHVAHRHGQQSIKDSRLTDLGLMLAGEAAKRSGSETFSRIMDAFDGSVNDVVNTLVVNGYSRSYEEEADRSAVQMLRKAGYRDGALITLLKTMKQRLKPGGSDFFATHPDPLERIASVREYVVQEDATVRARAVRFSRFFARIR